MKLTVRRIAALGAATALAAGALLAAPISQAADYPPVIPVAPPATGLLIIGVTTFAVTIVPLPDNGGVKITGPGFTATLVATDSGGTVNEIVEVNGRPVVLLQTDGEASTAGAGFKTFSLVNLFITYNGNEVIQVAKGSAKAGPIKLGSTTTDGKGEFKTTTPLPPGLAPGDYTITMAGTGPNGETVYLNTGVRIVAPKSAKATTKVFFAVASPNLSTGAEMDLNRLIRKVPAGAKNVKVRVVGYVQPTANTANDQSLSTARAKNVAAYLKDNGLKGAYTVTGNGRATQTGATARRVEVTVTYTK